MEEEDEIDVLGDFNLESLLTKNGNQISSCYDGDHQLGLHSESQWMLESTPQACWYENKLDVGCSALESYDCNAWTDKEKYLLEKGLELFGRSWSRLAQYIGTKTGNQVKSHVKTMGIGWTGSGKSSESTSSFGVDSTDLSFPELINDMDIPASVEEVIAAVSTALPTVVVPSSQRDCPSAHSYSSRSRKLNIQRKKKSAVATKRRLVTGKPKGTTQIYNVEEIKDALTASRDCDHIVVLPNGEQVIRMRRGSNLSEDSDVDIDVDSDVDKDKDNISLEECKNEMQKINEVIIDSEKSLKYKEETLPNKVEEKESVKYFVDDGISLEYSCKDKMEEIKEDIIDTEKSFLCKVETLTREMEEEDIEKCFVDDIGKEVSVSTANTLEEREEPVNRGTQVFKGSLVTPSGKIMTVIVDDMPCNPDDIDESSVTHSHSDVHLDQRQCHYNSSESTHSASVVESREDPGESVVLATQTGQTEKRQSGRERRKKLPFDEISERSPPVSTSKLKGNRIKSCAKEKESKICPRWRSHNQKSCIRKIRGGGYTTIHTDAGAVVSSYKSSITNNSISSRKNISKVMKPIKLVHCKSHSVGNMAPFRVEMEVSALVLVDIHSHLSPKSEVIGLLGGKYAARDGGVLRITTAVPCRTTLSSNTHCDMCPVSQLESSETITNGGLTVVGWYHSHPEFDPSPSDTDIATQNMLQSWFNEVGKPFVGLIISPYYSVNNISSYRFCHVIMEKEKNSLVPYKLDCKVTNIINANTILLRKSIEAAYETLDTSEDFKHRVTYRCLESVRHHLRKANPRVEEDKMFQVISAIHDFFYSVEPSSVV